MAVSVLKFEPYNEEEDVEQYFERLELFLTANGVEEDKVVGHVLSGIGARAYSVLRNLLAPTEPKNSDLATIKQKLVNHYKPKPPVIGQRFIFHQRVQKPGESINQFMMELRRIARTCDFGQFLQEALRDRLVCGLYNSSIQKRLLSEKDLTLQRAIDIAAAAEMAVLQPSDQITLQREPEVLAVQQVCKGCGKPGHTQGVCRFRLRVCFRCGKKRTSTDDVSKGANKTKKEFRRRETSICKTCGRRTGGPTPD